MQLSDTEKNHVISVIRKHLPNAEVKFFGSRTKGTAKKYSDLDVSIKEKQKIDLSILSAIKSDLSDSNIPFKIDITDYHRVSEGFQKLIDQEGVLIK